jgi:uncharacterized protein (DUF1810 family)
MKTEDPYYLQRFVAAQDAGGSYDHAAAELRAGRKTSHWMWFVFPQIAGLGYSPAARMYRLRDRGSHLKRFRRVRVEGTVSRRRCPPRGT